MKTLLTTDGSEYATVAMTAASRLLVRSGNQYDLMCVVPEFHPGVRSGKRSGGKIGRRRTAYEDNMRAEARNMLEAASRTLAREGLRAQPIVEVGPPAGVLLDRSENYDVVVAGAHSRKERPGPGLGPVASRILEGASVTILIGRELLNEKNFRILVAVDGSAASENAVETLASHFRLTGAEITLMHVIERPWLRLDLEAPQTDEPELEELFGGELRTEAEAIVEAARARLSGRSASTESLVVDGNPGVEILRQAEVGEYDLAVLGATGASDLKHTVLGSVSFKLGSNAPCSVAVVR